MTDMKVIRFPKDMRSYIRLVEQADADDMYGDIHPTSFGRRNGETFTSHGRADLKIRPNDARFGDNPLAFPGEGASLEEFADSEITPQLDQLHAALTKAGLSDVEIRHGVDLTDAGKEKLAAGLGISSEEVETYMNSLVQKLRDADSSTTDALLSDYYTGMSEGEDAPIWSGRMKESTKRPFDVGTMIENRYSIEPDALGNMTIRDKVSGKEKFLRGSIAVSVKDKLDGGADQDQTVAPLMEKMNQESEGGFQDEINTDAGSYNFTWSYQKQHGTGTLLYSMKNDRPNFRLISVRTSDGNDVLDNLSSSEYKIIHKQAMSMIGDA